MASLTSTINVNVDSDIKEEATILFNSLGLNMSTAINIFLRKAINVGGIPFDVRTNTLDETIYEKLKEAENEMSTNKKRYTSNEVFQSMNDIIG